MSGPSDTQDGESANGVDLATTCSLVLAQDTATPASANVAQMSDSTSRLCREGDDEHVDNQVTQAKKPLCFDDFEWEMKKVERAGKDINAPVIISIWDKNPLDTKFLELRDFSIANSIRGYKNKKKDVLLSLIAQRMKNNKIYGRIFRAKKNERPQRA
ncbi:hypothetical protein PF005_g707 [Phytophthora fragariae]|uniref:Uncharacterized protein n=1 Tax=Phytophthora fragariae TaxID=53985 RepID=A0A6A4AMN7_9STRA|nr:hypothetical protein PF003_g8379 [Phytophthora fragariae]KAE8950120.1 hypothetical protein PF009_g334 [Phytophthora fragariae]KAE9031578.1 hypothetical protein PF011_g18 [Phytophthora fragariae]KAE9140224.1 hypothetical protein PF010_g276 [Phytophthora fragariae]KAE9141314.1 hypothetical protein PF007_g283 [Phytophthora fragariae]